MPFTINFDEQNRIVHVAFTEIALKKDHYSALNAAVRLCNEKNTSGLLVDFSNLDSGSMTILDSFEFGQVVSKTSRVLHIAHVLPEDSRAIENIRFASTVETNRGKRTGEFETVEDAIAWLSKVVEKS